MSKNKIRRAFGPGRVGSSVMLVCFPPYIPPTVGPWGQNTRVNDRTPLFFRLCWRVVCLACYDMPVGGQRWPKVALLGRLNTPPGWFQATLEEAKIVIL